MYYQIDHMDGYDRIGSAEGTYCYLIEGSEQAMLIDTGYGFGDIKAAVRSITDKPLYILNTHGHCDHTGGNGRFEEACHIHEADLKLCHQHNTEEMRRSNAERSAHSLNYETGETFNALPEDFDMESYVSLGYGRLETVKPGTVIDLGGKTCELIETPGHTRGGLSVWYREKNLAYIGDAFGFFVWLFLEESTDQKTYVDMLDRMYALNADGYIAAHNPLVIRREELMSYKKAALEADYAAGEIFRTDMVKGAEPHVCPLPGMTMADMFKRGFASVVINEDWGKEN